MLATWLYLEDDDPFDTLNVSVRPDVAGWEPPAEIVLTKDGEQRTFRLQVRYDIPEQP